MKDTDADIGINKYFWYKLSEYSNYSAFDIAYRSDRVYYQDSLILEQRDKLEDEDWNLTMEQVRDTVD